MIGRVFAMMMGVALSSEIYVIDCDSIYSAMMDETLPPPDTLSSSVILKRQQYIKDQGIPRPLVYALDHLRSRKSAAFFVFVWSHQNSRTIMEKYFSLTPDAAQHRRDVINPSMGGMKEAWKIFKQGECVNLKKRPRDPLPVFFDDTMERPRKSYVIAAGEPEIQLFDPNGTVVGYGGAYKRRCLVDLSQEDVLYRKRCITKGLRDLRHLPLNHLVDDFTTKEQGSQKRQLSVLSYNILLKGLDVDGHQWDHRKQAVFQYIRQHDLIGLQEVTGIQFADLKSALPDYKFVAVNATTGGKLKRSAGLYDEGMVVAYRRGAFKVKASSHWWVSSTPAIPSKDVDSDEGEYYKITQRIEFVRVKDNFSLTFYNNHFPHGTMSKKRHDSRALAATMELDYIGQDLKANRFFISVGDRNFRQDRDQKTYERYLRFAGIGEASLSGTRGHKTTMLGYRNDEGSAIDDQGQFVNPVMLDVIFFGAKKAWVLDCVIHPVEYNQDGNLMKLRVVQDREKRRFGSDHAAVSVRFGLF